MSWRNGQTYAQDLRDRVLATPGRLQGRRALRRETKLMCAGQASRKARPEPSGRAVQSPAVRLATLENRAASSHKAPAHRYASCVDGVTGSSTAFRWGIDDVQDPGPVLADA
jgi:hypothetical protein